MSRIWNVTALAATMLIAAPVSAEPIGRWWTGFGQGTTEYGIKNDSAGSDTIYIACAPDHTYVSFRVGGVEPKQGETTIITIGADEYELNGGEWGYFETKSHVESDTFIALWQSLRSGAAARVRLQTGQSTAFTLKGASKVLGKEPCETDFGRF